MSGTGLAERATRLAAAAAGLGDRGWAAEARRLAGTDTPDEAAAPPTFAELAHSGVDVVQELAARGRWEDAADQARRLVGVFMRERARFGLVAGHAFDGLRAAAIARDEEELADFADLVREMFS